MNKLNKFLKSNKIPFVMLFAIMLVLTLTKQTLRDDIYFADFANFTGIPRLSWLIKWRFLYWSSRVVIETVLVLLARDFSWLWKILDPIVYVLLAYGIIRVFTKNHSKNRTMVTIMVSLILLIPQIILSTAGWMATSLNYLWPTTFAILCLIPIRKCIDKQPVKWFEVPIYMALAIFAQNVEQVAIVLCTVYVIFSLYFLFKKQITPTVLLMLCISIGSMALIFLCPGNANRTASEMELNFIDYPMLNLVDKIFIGLYSVMQYYILRFNPIYLVFTILMAVHICKKYDNIFYKAIAIFPIFMGTAFNIGNTAFKAAFEYMYEPFLMLIEEYKVLINFENFDQISTYVPIFLSIVNLGCLILSVYLAFGGTKKGIIALLTICAGIASKFIMGFVVTVFVSGIRAQFLFIISMIILTMMLLDDKSPRYLKNVSNVLVISAILMTINNFCLCNTLNF